MKNINPARRSRILHSFVNGKSALDICKHDDITPMELMLLCEKQLLQLPNELFELPLQYENHQFSITQNDHAKLLAEQDRLINQIKEYEIEIRIHQELLNKLITRN